MKNEIVKSPALWAILVALIVVPIEEAITNHNKNITAQQEEQQIAQQAQQETIRNAQAQFEIKKQQQVKIDDTNKAKKSVNRKATILLDAGEGGASKD